MRSLFRVLLFLVGFASIARPSRAQTPLFSETFGSLADGALLTTANTNFTYARTGTGAGALRQAASPGLFGAGSSGRLLGTDNSITGLGVLNNSLTTFDVGTIAFDLRTPTTITNGSSFFFGLGTGTMFTNDVAFNSSHLLAGFQITATGGVPVFQARSGGAWNTVSSLALSGGTNYSFRVVFNGSASPVNYDSFSVGAGRADIFVDGALVGDDIAIQDSQSATAFRFYSQGQAAGSGAPEIDNLMLFNSAVGSAMIPEPSAIVFGILGIGGLIAARRHRK